MNIQIRKVQTIEADILLQLSRTTFFDAFAAKNNPADMEKYAFESFTISKIRSELNNPHSSFYFALVDDEIAGYLKLNTGDAQTEFKLPDALEIERIYILAKYQGKNIGGQLINFAIDIAVQGNYRHIWLGVFEQNTGAIRFYQKHGFDKFSTHYFMLGDDKQTDTLMKRDLV